MMNDRFTRIKWLVGEEKLKIFTNKSFGLRTWWSGWGFALMRFIVVVLKTLL